MLVQYKITLRYKLINFLNILLAFLHKPNNDLEKKARLESVLDFFDETLPSINPEFREKAICEGGKWNYFRLLDGSFPKYDLTIPEIPLYVCVPGIESASWEEARLRGITRLEWETAQHNLDTIEEETAKLATIGVSTPPKILIIRWGETVNHHTLLRRVGALLNNETNS